MSSKPLQGIRVLIMEDEFLIAMDVEQLCRDHGAQEVVIMRKLEELGTDPFERPGFDAAVIDIRLGSDLTLDFARQLAERNVPFVFATGYSETEALLTTFPDVTVISKPYAGNALIEAMCAAIERNKPSGCV